MGVKMASYFATVLEDKVSVAKAVPQNTKKAMKFGLSLFTGSLKITFFLDLQ